MRELFSPAVLFCALALGFSAADRLRKRETALCALRQMLLEVHLSLSFGSVPLPALLLSLSQEARFARVPFLSALTLLLQNGEALPDAWNAAAAAAASSLGKEGSALLLRLGAVLGKTDKPGQLEVLSREIAALDALCAAALQKRRRNGALYRAAGAFFGVSAFLILM
ncbi:MAG: hypothetical protein IJU56_00095 [Clostridia bacterium]|nr:hypothetical protein [Clostridia bacterium]